MLKVKKITDVIGKKAYTDTGDFFGEVEESNLIENKLIAGELESRAQWVIFLEVLEV